MLGWLIMEWIIEVLKVIIEVLIVIWDNLTKITPLIIGAGLIYIGWQQHKTNKDRLKMELFDRRYKIYEAMAEFVTTEVITKDDIKKYKVNAAQSTFVFGKDVQDALLKVGGIGRLIVYPVSADISSRSVR